MKKILLFLFCTTFAFSQLKKTIVPKLSAKIETREATLQQYDFLKSIKDKYPTFIISTKLDNLYVDGQLLQSQYIIEDKTGTYTIVIQPDNEELSYFLELVNIGTSKGQYLKLGAIIVKTELIADKEYNVYFDGKKEL